jgi:hypothetical protein
MVIATLMAGLIHERVIDSLIDVGPGRPNEAPLFLKGACPLRIGARGRRSSAC